MNITKGPWEVQKYKSTYKAPNMLVIGNATHEIAYLPRKSTMDARAIAEVPAMVEVIRQIAKHFQDTDAPLGINARAILKQIEG